MTQASREPRPLLFHAFGDDPLSQLAATDERVPQARYLVEYLARLGAHSVVEEPYYFDRDYLSEFASFYGTSVRGYENVCRRLTFFRADVAREHLVNALSALDPAYLQEHFLGLVVLRPIHRTPLGKTVVGWYPDEKTPPRVIGPARDYLVHLAGLELRTRGLAWQQQDVAVGSCATIALWSMLHSSAFDEHHAVPTTAEITRSAVHPTSSGARTFPSKGLTIQQMCEAIKANNLVPDVLEGNGRFQRIPGTSNPGLHKGFTRARFGASIGLYLRSGYALLVSGRHIRSGEPSSTMHAVTCVGLRGRVVPEAATSDARFEDADVEFVYIHDDNIGPGARMRLLDTAPNEPALLVRSPPGKSPDDDTAADEAAPEVDAFLPQVIVAAVHAEIRLSADRLHDVSTVIANNLAGMLSEASQPEPTTYGARIMPVWKYLGEQLADLELEQTAVASTRLALVEALPPMSRYIGVARLRVGGRAFADVLVDTTDQYACVFGYVAFDEEAFEMMAALDYAGPPGLGVGVRAYA